MYTNISAAAGLYSIDSISAVVTDFTVAQSS